MHVLGTPPAFILSQDQTLRTVVQRLALLGFEVEVRTDQQGRATQPER